MPPLARPTRPRHPWRRVASTSWRAAAPAAKPAEPKTPAAARGPSAPASTRDDQRTDAAPRRPEQPVAQQLGAGLAPRQHRRDGHQEQQDEADRHGHAGRRTARRPRSAVLQGLDDQREHRAEQHDEREHGEDHVVGEERALAGDRRVDRARRAQPVAAPRDQARATTATTMPKKPSRNGPIVPLLNACTLWMTPRAGEERAEDRQRERGDEQADRFHTRNMPRRSWTSTEWMYAVPVSHGRRLAFSTGSQPHTPLQPSTS